MSVTLQFPSEFGTKFDVAQFDKSIRSHGIRFTHWRAQDCPVGMIDKHDERHPNDDHSGCSRGQIFTLAGTVTGMFTGSGAKVDQQGFGTMDGSTVMVTLPTRYDDSNEEVHVLNFDRLYVDDGILVPKTQLVEAHIVGRDRLDFPVEKVIDIIDANGKRYGQDAFTVEGGQIVWGVGRGPSFNAELNAGTIYSCRYLYRPYWIVQRLVHQVRLATVTVPGGKETVRMPSQFLLQREQVFMNEAKDAQAPDPESPRQVRGPKEGPYGPR